MKLTVGEIAEFLKGTVEGDTSLEINMLADIRVAKASHITFLSNPKYEQYIYTTEATAVIVDNNFTSKKNIKRALIRVENPYLGFTKLLQEYHKQIIFDKTGIEEPCHRGKNLEIGDNIYQGAFSYIGDNVKIGNNVKIYPHTFIDDNTLIGDNTVLYSGVKLYGATQIGKNCTIHAGAVLGSYGFGFAQQKGGEYQTIPQLGYVFLGDNVSIGANTVIDCATLLGQSTIIQSGVKLDNLVQVAHNVKIGKNTLIAAQSGVSGSTSLGNQCLIAGQVGITGHLSIADNTAIGAKSGIMKSVETKGEQLFGIPALNKTDYLKSFSIFKQLPEMKQKIEQLEKQLKCKK